MKFTSRVEVPIYAFLLGMSIILGRFAILPAHVSCFVAGAFVGSGLLLAIISFLPQTVYEKMPYREWIDSRANK